VSEIRTGIVAAARCGYDGYGWTGSLLERTENVDRLAVSRATSRPTSPGSARCR